MDNFAIESCSLCPRSCKAKRLATDFGSGFCTLPALPGICRAEKHFWEEPSISGTRGSGAIFFSGCVLRCEFCQNSKISRKPCGQIMDANKLAEIFKRLEADGAHNINLVSPTPYYPVIIKALQKYRPQIPIVCNTSGYEKVETLKALEGLIDIYLPDFKYSDSAIAKKYSAAEDYPETALAAIKEMLRQVGTPKFDENEIMQSGVMIRHLILPNNIDNSYGVLEAVADNFPPESYLSLMAQYFPTGNETHEELKRKITQEEYERVSSYMLLLGLENGYVQQLEAASDSFVPDWNML